jgi:quercetin dioxygenase-like cupin family protein
MAIAKSVRGEEKVAETKPIPADWSHITNMDDRTPGRFRNYVPKAKLRTKGWDAFSVPENIQPTDEPGRIGLTNKRYATVGINLYPPGGRDEMHCHPGSEHVFFCFQGELTIHGINEGEDVVLKPGEFVHINQSYYYQLANESNQMTVIYSVFTKPPKPPKISRYSYRGTDGVDPATLEGE